MTVQVAGIVLAAGASARMGEVPKQTLPFGESTMVGTVVETAKRGGLKPVVVVVGFHAECVERAVRGKADVVVNPDPTRGNFSSLEVGLRAVENSAGVIVLLGDMPEVSAETVAQLVVGLAGGRRIGWVEHNGERTHPIAISSDIVPDAMSLSGDRPVWSFLDSFEPEDGFIVNGGPLAPIDVNTPLDYREVMERQE